MRTVARAQQQQQVSCDAQHEQHADDDEKVFQERMLTDFRPIFFQLFQHGIVLSFMFGDRNCLAVVRTDPFRLFQGISLSDLAVKGVAFDGPVAGCRDDAAHLLRGHRRALVVGSGHQIGRASCRERV